MKETIIKHTNLQNVEDFLRMGFLVKFLQVTLDFCRIYYSEYNNERVLFLTGILWSKVHLLCHNLNGKKNIILKFILFDKFVNEYDSL